MLDKKRALLVVIDIQGNLARLMFDRENLFRAVGVMIDGARALDIPIIWVEQYPQGLGPTIPEIASHLEGLSPMPKRSFSTFADPIIRKRLVGLGRDQIVITGIESHICVHQTALDCHMRGIETFVAADAVSSRTETSKNIALEKMARTGIVITSVETALFELLGTSEGELFKKVLAIVK